MNLLLVCIGTVFLLNPCVYTVDVLPDFLGVLIIMYGLRNLFQISEPIDNINGKLWGLFTVGVLRLAASVIYGRVDGSLKMLFSFCLSAAEVVLIPVIFKGIFDGLEVLKIRHGTVFAAGDGEKNAYLKYDFLKLKMFLSVYTVIRIVVSFLPEATELRLAVGGGKVIAENIEPLASFKPMLYMFASVPLCVYMLVCVIKCFKTFKLYALDKGMAQNISRLIESDRKTFPTKYRRRKLNSVYYFMMVGVIFSLFFYTDGINRIPKLAAAVVFSVFFVIFSENKKEKTLGLVSCGALAVSSAMYYIFSGFANGGGGYIFLIISAFLEGMSLFGALFVSSGVTEKAALSAFEQIHDIEIKSKRSTKLKRQILIYRIFSALFCISAAVCIPLFSVVPIMNFIIMLLNVSMFFLTYSLDIQL